MNGMTKAFFVASSVKIALRWFVTLVPSARSCSSKSSVAMAVTIDQQRDQIQAIRAPKVQRRRSGRNPTGSAREPAGCGWNSVTGLAPLTLNNPIHDVLGEGAELDVAALRHGHA